VSAPERELGRSASTRRWDGFVGRWAGRGGAAPTPGTEGARLEGSVEATRVVVFGVLRVSARAGPGGSAARRIALWWWPATARAGSRAGARDQRAAAVRPGWARPVAGTDACRVGRSAVARPSRSAARARPREPAAWASSTDANRVGRGVPPRGGRERGSARRVLHQADRARAGPDTPRPGAVGDTAGRCTRSSPGDRRSRGATAAPRPARRWASPRTCATLAARPGVDVPCAAARRRRRTARFDRGRSRSIEVDRGRCRAGDDGGTMLRARPTFGRGARTAWQGPWTVVPGPWSVDRRSRGSKVRGLASHRSPSEPDVGRNEEPLTRHSCAATAGARVAPGGPVTGVSVATATRGGLGVRGGRRPSRSDASAV
jgi:hypothetical protein